MDHSRAASIPKVLLAALGLFSLGAVATAPAVAEPGSPATHAPPVSLQSGDQQWNSYEEDENNGNDDDPAHRDRDGFDLGELLEDLDDVLDELGDLLEELGDLIGDIF